MNFELKQWLTSLLGVYRHSGRAKWAEMLVFFFPPPSRAIEMQKPYIVGKNSDSYKKERLEVYIYNYNYNSK